MYILTKGRVTILHNKIKPLKKEQNYTSIYYSKICLVNTYICDIFYNKETYYFQQLHKTSYSILFGGFEPTTYGSSFQYGMKSNRNKERVIFIRIFLGFHVILGLLELALK